MCHIEKLVKQLNKIWEIFLLLNTGLSFKRVITTTKTCIFRQQVHKIEIQCSYHLPLIQISTTLIHTKIHFKSYTLAALVMVTNLNKERNFFLLRSWVLSPYNKVAGKFSFVKRKMLYIEFTLQLNHLSFLIPIWLYPTPQRKQGKNISWVTSRHQVHAV